MPWYTVLYNSSMVQRSKAKTKKHTISATSIFKNQGAPPGRPFESRWTNKNPAPHPRDGSDKRTSNERDQRRANRAAREQRATGASKPAADEQRAEAATSRTEQRETSPGSERASPGASDDDKRTEQRASNERQGASKPTATKNTV